MKKRIWIILALGLVIFFGLYLAAGFKMHSQLSDISGRCDGYFEQNPGNFSDLSNFWRNEAFDETKYRVAEYEKVRFASREEGIEISAWYAEARPKGPTVILVHGLGSCKHKTTVLVPGGMLYQAGLNVLTIDVRDAGESTFEDGYSAIGNEEYRDALGAWDWLQQEKGIPREKIGIFGNSLGAATSLIAFSQEPELAAVFVDAPFDNLAQIASEELKREGYPQLLFYAGWLAGMIRGDNLLAHNPYEAIEKAGDRPVFVIHSKGDQRIGVHHSYQLRERAEKVGAKATFWIMDEIDHVQTAGAFPEEYEEKLVSFFKNALK